MTLRVPGNTGLSTWEHLVEKLQGRRALSQQAVAHILQSLPGQARRPLPPDEVCGRAHASVFGQDALHHIQGLQRRSG